MVVLCLSLYLVTLVSISPASADSHIYVSATNGSSDPNCGSSIDFPCLDIGGLFNTIASKETKDTIVFFNGTQSYNSSVGRHYIYYLPGVYKAIPSFLYQFHGFSFIGLGNVTIEVDQFYVRYNSLWPLMSTVELEVSSVRRYPAAFYFRECTDIRIENFNFYISYNVANLAGITFDLSSDVVVDNCSFSEVSRDSSAIVIVHPVGFTLLTDVSIESLHGLKGYHQLLIVAFSKIEFESIFRNLFDVHLVNVRIADIMAADYKHQSVQQLLSGVMQYPDYDYKDNWKAATAILVLFRKGSLARVFKMRNCVIHNVKPNDHRSPVTIQFEDASLNLVEIENCTFTSNFGSVGGSVAIFFDKNAGNSQFSANHVHFNHVHFRNCTFADNSALFNGGAVFVDYLTDAASNDVQFENMLFLNNQAPFGAALLLRYDHETGEGMTTRNPKEVVITDSTFIGNRASHGIVYAYAISLTISGKSVFDSNEESCIVLISSSLHLEGYSRFSRNRATDGAAISLNGRSMVYMNAVQHAEFVDNVANRHGGVIWADHDTAAETYNQFLLHSTTFIDLSRPCCVRFGNEREIPGQQDIVQDEAKFLFDGNRAGVQGDIFYFYSFRHCWLGNFVPLPLPSRRIKSDGLQHVVTSFKNIRLASYKNMITTAASAPNFFALAGASCRCFKPVGPVYISLTSCLSDIALTVFSTISALNSSAELLADEFDDFANPSAGIGVTPPSELLYFPWTFTVYDDTKQPGSQRNKSLQPNPSLIILTPAPGEYFDLNFTLHGQFMESSDVTAYIQVEAVGDTKSVALLEYNGFIYPSNSRIYFSPNSPLSNLRLHGLTGTSGTFVARTSSHVLGLELVVRVPFMLSSCPLGFSPPTAAYQKETVGYLFDLLGPQKVTPMDQLSSFACNCYSINNTYNSAVSYCTDGYTAHMYKSKWLGDPSAVRNNNKTSYCNLINYKPNRSDIACYVDPPTKVVTIGESTAFAGCVLAFCKDIETETWIESDGICSENRQGPLCGKCKDGYAVTPSSLNCVKCKDQEGLIIFLTFFFGLLIVLAAILLNIRISPLGAGLLFFTQMSALFLDFGSGAYFIIHLVNLDFSFGLCYSSNFTAIERLASHFVPPVYMIILVILFTLVAGRIRRISRYVSKRSCLGGVWLIILLSYFSLANVCFGFMQCVELKPSDTVSPTYRFLHDPAFGCYENPHLAFFLLSCFVAGLFVLPFPIIVLLLRRSTRFKPFADICYSIFKDSHWWWCAVDLQRRLLFTLIYTFVPGQDSQTLKNTLLIISSALVLLVHGMSWPYKSTFENVFELLLLFDLCCISAISAGLGGGLHSWLIADLIYIPWIVGLAVWTYQKRYRLVRCGQKIGLCMSYNKESSQAVKGRSSVTENDIMYNKDNIELELKRRGSTIVLAGLRDRLLDGHESCE